MPLHKILNTEEGVQIGIWKIDETEKDFASLLPAVCMTEATQGITSEKRKSERWAVRALFQALTGAIPEIIYKEDGSPRLKNGKYNISISHTNGFAALALHPHRKPGIDIERLRSRILRVKNHVFSAEEIKQLAANDEKEEILSSTLYWCAKETAFKMIGSPVYDYKQELFIPPFAQRQEGEFILRNCSGQPPAILPISYQITPDYVLTWSCY